MHEEGSPIDGASHTIDYTTAIPVDDADLPLKLPEMSDFKPGEDPAERNTAELKSGATFKGVKWYARETNTMPQWAGSCWYYLKFADPRNSEALFSKEAAEWLPVDLYVGGQEHAVLHLLYARFWHKVLNDLGIVFIPSPLQIWFIRGYDSGDRRGENEQEQRECHKSGRRCAKAWCRRSENVRDVYGPS